MTEAKPVYDPESPGAEKIINASLAATAGFGLLSLVTYLLAERVDPQPSDSVFLSSDAVFAVICAVLFAIGTLLLGLGLWNGIQRSRVEEVTLTGLVSVDSTHVPRSARNRLWMAIVLQIVIGVLFGSLRPFTVQAFGLLVPILGLGFAGLWGSRFGAFYPRDDR